MKRDQIVRRINQLIGSGLYTYEDIKYDLDDVIGIINTALYSKYPLFTEIMTDPDMEYTYYAVGGSLVWFKTELDAKKYIVNNSLVHQTERKLPIFPEQYIQSVVIPYVVAQLLAREDEFGNAYNNQMQRHTIGIHEMIRDHLEKVQPYFQDRNKGYLDWERSHNEDTVNLHKPNPFNEEDF